MNVHSSENIRQAMALYAVTDRTWLGGRRLEEQVGDALKGGATCVQLREKDLPKEEFFAEASRIQALCAKYGALFIVNDAVDAAIACGADGIHVGQSDMGARQVRAAIGKDMILGVSASTVEEALRAQAEGADYLGVGAIFPTPTKTDAAAVGPEGLSAICAAVSIPVVAIGGLNKENLRCLSGTGASGAALVSAIFAAKNIEAACRELKSELEAILGGSDARTAQSGGDSAEGASLPDGNTHASQARSPGLMRRLRHSHPEPGSGAVLLGPGGKTLELQGAIFDMDGTLLDSMHVWDDVAVQYLLDRDIRPKEDLNKVFRSMSLGDAAIYYQEAYGIDESVEDIMAGINAMIGYFYKNEVHPKPGVRELLDSLAERGVAMCVATATEKSLSEAALGRCGLLNYFSFVITCGEMGSGKDTPEIFEEALRRLGCGKSLTAVFEDAAHALKTANTAGFPTVGVYDGSYRDMQDEIRGSSSIYIRDFGELRLDGRYSKT